MIFQGQEFLEDKYFQDSVPLDWTKLTTYAGIHAALPRSDSAPPELVQSDARPRRPAAQRPPRQQRRQGSRLSSLGRWRAGRRCRGGGQFRQPQLRRLHVRVPTRGTVARAFQQRLAGVQPGLRQSAGLRHVRGRRSDGQHAMPSRGRHWPVHCSCPVPGPLRQFTSTLRDVCEEAARVVDEDAPQRRLARRRPSGASARTPSRSARSPGPPFFFKRPAVAEVRRQQQLIGVAGLEERQNRR